MINEYSHQREHALRVAELDRRLELQRQLRAADLGGAPAVSRPRAELALGLRRVADRIERREPSPLFRVI